MLRRYIRILRYGFSLDRVYLPIRLVLVFWSFVSSAITLLLPKYLLQAISAGKPRSILAILAISLFVSLFGALIEKFFSPRIASRRERLNAKILDSFLRKSIDFELAYFDQSGAYDKYTLVFGQCCAVVHGVTNTLCTFVSSLLQVAFVIYVLSWLSPIVLILFLCVCIAQTYINNLTKRDTYKYQKQMAHHNRKLNYLYRLFHIPEFMRDIRVNDIKQFIFQKKQGVTDYVLNDTQFANKRIADKTFVVSLISMAESFVTTLYFAWQVIRQIIWYDDFVVSLNAYRQLKNAISQILSTFVELSANDMYAKDYLSFMDRRPQMGSGRKELSQVDTLEFKNVCFRYPNTTEYALRNICFSLKKGERLAIIGKNGAGKTTIIKLLLRLYDPDEGTIEINGVNIREYDLSALRRVISVLFQDYSIYAFSVRENLTLGADISDEEIITVLKRVNLWEKIEKLPLGLDTPITNQLYEGGIEFSGGEKQRLALARLYLKRQSMFVLDEPTSSLDPFIESKFYKDLLENTDNTLIVISHRSTFSHRMSRIICINSGRIEEIGTPDELLRNPESLYKEMYDLNTDKYIQPVE